LSDFAAGKARRIASDLQAAKQKYSNEKDYNIAAKAIVKRHRQWLEVESQTVTVTCFETEALRRFEKRRNIAPNLILLTTGDARVRDEHAALHSICKPFDDPFWKSHTPPLGWMCRCGLQSTNKPATVGDVESSIKTPKGLQHRMLDSGLIFGDGSVNTGEAHAYFENLQPKVANKLQTGSELTNLREIAVKNSEFVAKSGEKLIATTKAIDLILAQNHNQSALRNTVLAYLHLILPESEVVEGVTEFAVLNQVFKIIFDNNELKSIE
jgi:hypothetical protein